MFPNTPRKHMKIFRFVNSSSAMCGVNTQCTNGVGNYSCPCLLGYTNYSAGVGCQDLNECIANDCYYSYTQVNLHILVFLKMISFRVYILKAHKHVILYSTFCRNRILLDSRNTRFLKIILDSADILDFKTFLSTLI